MFKKWFRFGATEVANNIRTSQYVANGLRPVGAVIKDCSDCDDLAEVTGQADGEYRTPSLDDAPWFTPDDPDTGDFAGVMVVDVTGLTGSTTVVDVEEKLGDGGVVGARRATSRTVGVTADLVGRTPEATAVGLEWLSAILHPPCAEGSCAGDALHFYSTCPMACEGVTDPDAAPVTIRFDEYADFSGRERDAAQPLTNHLTNSSFQSGTTGWTSESLFVFNPGTLASVAPTGGVAPAPTRSNVMRLTMGSFVTTNPSSLRQTVTGLTVGRTYTLSGWIYVPTASGANSRWALNFFGVFFGTGDYITVKDTWVYAQFMFQATSTTHEVGWTTVNDSTNPVTNGGQVFFDGMMLTEGSNGGGTGFSGVSTEGWLTSDPFGLITVPVLSVSATGGNPGRCLNLAWKATADAGTTSHGSYGILPWTVPDEVYTITFDVWVPTGSPDVQPHVMFQDRSAGAWITAKNTWVPVTIIAAADSDFMRVGIRHLTMNPGAGKSARVDNFRAWRTIGVLDNGHFDGATPDATYANIGAGIAQTATGTMVLSTGVGDGEDIWTRATHTTTSAARTTIPAASLTNHRLYWASYVVKNPTNLPVTVSVNFAHSGDSTYTLAPGETRRLYGMGRAASYTNAADRFSDLILPGSSSEVLFRDFRLEAAAPATYDWLGTAETSKSTRTPMGGTLFDPDSSTSALQSMPLAPVCDDVKVEWTVSSANGTTVQVYPVMTALDGTQVRGDVQTVGPNAPGSVGMSAGATPGFPDKWTASVRTLPDGWSPGAVPTTNPYIPAGSLLNPEALVPFWNATLERDTRTVPVAMLGDSITEGIGAGTWNVRPTVALQNRLRSVWPINGSQGVGYVPAYNFASIAAPGLTVLAGALVPFDQWTGADYYGLGSKAAKVLSTDLLRYTFTGNRIRVWYGWSSVAYSTANGEIRVDGGAWQTMTSDTEDGSGQFFDSGTLAPGSHYVEIRGTTTFVPFVLEGFEVFGSEQDRTSGIHVYDSSHSSFFSTQFTGTSIPNGSRVWQVLDKVKPVLFYINLGTNDFAWGITPAQTKANLQAIIARCAVAAAGQPYSVLVVLGYTAISPTTGFAANWANVRTAVLSLAGGNVAVFDLNSVWPVLSPGNPQGVMLETDYPLHPNAVGHALQTDTIMNVLVNGWTTGEDVIDVTVTTPGEAIVIHSLDVTHRPVLTVEECTKPYRRTLHNVVTVAGPKVIEERTLGDITDGSTVWRVEWTWVATEPHVWHDPEAILLGVPGKTGTPVYQAPGVPVSAGASVPVSGTACALPAPAVLTCADNPTTAGIVLPPLAPVLADPNVMNLTGKTYTRRFFEIPADLSPVGVGSLSWTFVNDSVAKFGVRVRIYEDTDPAFVQPTECSFIEEFTIEYLAPDQTLYIDGPADDVYVKCGEDIFQQPIYAPALRNLRGNYGGPFKNTPVGCGRPYFITVDIPNVYGTGIAGYAENTSQGSLVWSVNLTRRA